MGFLDLDEIRRRGRALWDRGDLLRAYLGDGTLFPLAIPLTRGQRKEVFPGSDLLKGWQQAIEEAGKCRSGTGYRIEYVREQGRRRPDRVVFDTPFDLIRFLGLQYELQRFVSRAQYIRRRFPALGGWIRRHPMQVLAWHRQWPRLLEHLAGPAAGETADEARIGAEERALLERLRQVLEREGGRRRRDSAASEAYNGAGTTNMKSKNRQD